MQSPTLHMTSRHQRQIASRTSSVSFSGRPHSLKKGGDSSNGLKDTQTHSHRQTEGKVYTVTRVQTMWEDLMCCQQMKRKKGRQSRGECEEKRDGSNEINGGENSRDKRDGHTHAHRSKMSKSTQKGEPDNYTCTLEVSSIDRGIYIFSTFLKF